MRTTRKVQKGGECMCDGRAGESGKNEVSFEDGQSFDKQRWGMGVIG